jgi:glycosyltransferase involved in cell wall biosynthesis
LGAEPSPRRVLGVSVADVGDWREPLPAGKWSQFYAALNRRLPVVDVISPRASSASRYLNLARSARPNLEAWRALAGFNQRQLAARNASLRSQARGLAGSYDLIVQLQTLCSAHEAAPGIPYVIYTDNTMALTQALYPSFARLTPRVARRWEQFEADLCRHAASVYTFSHFARRSLIDDYGVAPTRVTAIGTGANQGLSSLDGRDYSRPMALFVGIDFARKGGPSLLEAWRRVREALPAAELVLAGPAVDPRGPRDAGVRYVGAVDRGALAALYSTARVFVMPSVFEPWGFVFAEAMGHGLACIGTDCCAMPELIDDGVTGRLVPPSDAGALATAMIELLGDADRARAMGAAGHERVRSELTWDRVVDRFLDALPRD